MKAQSLGNDLWTFAIKDTLYRPNPDGFSCTMIEFSAVE
jgi:hypothetical protein